MACDFLLTDIEFLCNEIDTAIATKETPEGSKPWRCRLAGLCSEIIPL
jgi:hypothetical protein